jgi:NADP-dependent 3-hydroxy acid dehydrogenase YdfG
MPTIAIVGAGQQLGAAIARTFGAHGHKIALIARNQERLARLTSDLTDSGLAAASFVADVRDSVALTTALAAAEEQFGGIDVLEYSPLPASEYLKPVLETTPEQAQGAFEFSVLGPLAAVRAVLPGMRARGGGSLLFSTGGSSLVPNPKVAGTSISMAGEAAYIAMLNEVLAGENIRVRHLVIPVRIGPGEPLGDPENLAERLWALHSDPDQFRAVVGQ